MELPSDGGHPMTPGEEGLRVPNWHPIGVCVEFYTCVNMTNAPPSFQNTVAAHLKPQSVQDPVPECRQDGNS